MKASTILIRVLGVLLCAWPAARLHAYEPVAGVRLYVLDCGAMTIRDMGLFSDTGKYDGQSGRIVDTCFLIRHPKGNLLWDTGLGDALVGHDVPANADGVALHVERGLLDQLAQIGVTPADVTYLAFSHFHLDHTGNANAFGSSTWILNQAELAWALRNPPPPIVNVDTFSAYRSAHTIMIHSDYDVFGDGSVRILKTPGHTPGHQVLLVRLSKSGAVLLSGDLYHLQSDRPKGPGGGAQVMQVNDSRADTLASMDRVEGLIRNLHARLIVQHDPDDYRQLPKSPNYLE
ncbi:MAG: N-acyl homoserine lactonase family protein [Steroidobacteraceae bacterium]